MSIRRAIATTSLWLIASLGEPTAMQAQQTTGVPPQILYFRAKPPSVLDGDSAELEWSTLGASTVTITGIGEVSTSGRQAVTPRGDTTYELSATNAHGSIGARTVISKVSLTIIAPDEVSDVGE